MAGRKIFVGSLPQTITDEALRLEFNKYGAVQEVFVKQNCDPGRQWAFVTFASADQAQFAKEQCDRTLVFPGGDRPCDVMVAKNQGMFGQQSNPGEGPPAYPSQAPGAPKKIFVGSLPDGIPDEVLKDEFSKYGLVTDVFLKEGCESGKTWGFVTFNDAAEADYAVSSTNGVLMFPGSVRACEVTLARNQGMFGQGSLHGGGAAAPVVQSTPIDPGAPRKIFVGSLPDDISEMMLRAEFSKYGQITDVFIKPGCEPGRQWAFVTFATPDQAQSAKVACDMVLRFPGAARTCEVTLARHQGMFGQDAISSAPQAPAPVAEGPKKIFVGSLPDDITEPLLRAEFSKYGQVVDVFVKPGCEPGRQWAFVSFASHQQASFAKESTDRVLSFHGSSKTCEVMLAKNQGKFGQDPISGGGQSAPNGGARPAFGGGVAGAGMVVAPPGGQPPPPTTPPPPELTPWRMYETVGGLPYYHNHVTGVTQWEAPPELQAPGSNSRVPPPGGATQVMRPPRQAVHGGGRYAPY